MSEDQIVLRIGEDGIARLAEPVVPHYLLLVISVGGPSGPPRVRMEVTLPDPEDPRLPVYGAIDMTADEADARAAELRTAAAQLRQREAAR